MSAAQVFLTINAYVSPIENDRKGAIAIIIVMPQIIYFLFLDFPLHKYEADSNPIITIVNATIIAVNRFPSFIAQGHYMGLKTN